MVWDGESPICPVHSGVRTYVLLRNLPRGEPCKYSFLPSLAHIGGQLGDLRGIARIQLAYMARKYKISLSAKQLITLVFFMRNILHLNPREGL